MLDEVKHVKPTPPKQYSGEDDVKVFETWLADLLRWFRVTGITGDSKDQLRIDLCGTNLTGSAATWFHTEVEAWDRSRIDWVFEDLIIGLYQRFIHEVTAQNAAINFAKAKYSKAKGALAFYNELDDQANRMIERPDGYTFKRHLLNGLPPEMVETLIKSRGVTAELTPISRLLIEIKAAENRMQAFEHYKQNRQISGSASKGTTPSTDTSKSVKVSKSRPFMGDRSISTASFRPKQKSNDRNT